MNVKLATQDMNYPEIHVHRCQLCAVIPMIPAHLNVTVAVPVPNGQYRQESRILLCLMVIGIEEGHISFHQDILAKMVHVLVH